MRVIQYSAFLHFFVLLIYFTSVQNWKWTDMHLNYKTECSNVKFYPKILCIIESHLCENVRANEPFLFFFLLFLPYIHFTKDFNCSFLSYLLCIYSSFFSFKVKFLFLLPFFHSFALLLLLLFGSLFVLYLWVFFK